MAPSRNRSVKPLLFLIGILLFPHAFPGQVGEKSLVLQALEEELARSMKELAEKGDPPPYFISYQVTEIQGGRLEASYGALRENSADHSRFLDVEVRVGDYGLDNTHPVRGRRFPFGFPFSGPPRLPIEDDLDALKSALWLQTDRRYRQAVERLIQVRTDLAVKVKESRESPDFSHETPKSFIGPVSRLVLESEMWGRKLKAYSSLFKEFPEIHKSKVTLTANATTKYFVNSEGTVIQNGWTHWRMAVTAETKAGDGMDLQRSEVFDAHSPDRLPNDETVRRKTQRLAEDLLALREAPELEPYTGPAILSGRSAAVFFHEIFGHRIEGHRQKDLEEGQTFTKRINQQILPEFISIYDDPTRKRFGEADLNGHYQFDDEGVEARRVAVVENGVLKNFLMSRSPIPEFQESNGHGRKQPGFRPVGRQGNLILEASRTVSEDELRRMLLEECKKQGLPFGLFFKDIQGGLTMTRRGFPQTYQVVPTLVYRVYTDGRPDELVRGADLIGTPLVSFSKILACGEKTEVFNGYCGAESGLVPVSAVAPAILTAQIEIQKKEKSPDRPPILPPPGTQER